MAERILDGRTLLITGGAGFIGSNFIHYLLSNYRDIRVINLDKLTYAGNPDNLKDIENDPRYSFIHGDIRDHKLVEEVMGRVDGIIHLAAETHVDRSIVDAGEFILTDVYGTFALLEALKKAKIDFFLHVSTDEVYGSRKSGFFNEKDPLNPSSPYAASKAGADRLAYSYFVTYEFPIFIVRPSNNYGPYQYPEKFIPLFITNAMEDIALPLYGRGENYRDWLHVQDHCRALDLICRLGEPGEVYNIGANQEVDNLTVAHNIVDSLGKSRDLIRFVKDRRGHDFRYALDCAKLNGLGWQPCVNFSQGLTETVEWYRGNQEWWTKIKHKNEEYLAFQKSYYKDRS